MNRRILAAGFLAVALFCAAGCEKDVTCPPCNQEDPAVSGAIDVLVATALAFPRMSRHLPGPLLESGILPEGSSVDTFSILDYSRQLVMPSPEMLREYDAIMLFTYAWPDDVPGPDAYDAIGDLLADYVDAGGGLVICEFAINGMAAGIRGRIATPGYAPFSQGSAEVNYDEEEDRLVVMESIEFPLHPVFYGVAVDTLVLPGHHFLGYPELDETATLLAMDDHGTNAVAVNAAGNIIGLNMHFKHLALPDDYPEAVRLTANSILYVAEAADRR